MATEVITDKDMLAAIDAAIAYEQVKAKWTYCYMCSPYEYHKDKDNPASIPDVWKCSKGHEVKSRGWEISDISTTWNTVRKMVQNGYCRQVYRSNKHTEYRLVDRDAMVSLVNLSYARPAVYHGTGGSSNTGTLPADMFDSIIGHDDIKRLMKKVVLSSVPLHVLLIGPPASAKTMFQLEIESLPGAYFMDGASVTKAGLYDLLFENNIRYLIIDEIEEMKQEELGALTSFMQTGKLTETKYGRTRSKDIDTVVIASCNVVSKFKPKMLSRFLKITFPPYTREEFTLIVRFLLKNKYPNMTVDTIIRIDEAVWNKLETRDLRDVIKIAALVDDEHDVDWIANTLTTYKS